MLTRDSPGGGSDFERRAARTWVHLKSTRDRSSNGDVLSEAPSRARALRTDHELQAIRERRVVGRRDAVVAAPDLRVDHGSRYGEVRLRRAAERSDREG